MEEEALHERTTADERLWLGIMAALAIAARIWLIFGFRIDSDEPQHLHVACGWTHGFLPYRDVFDNHLPLLHVLFAPVMALVPESSTAFTLMRLAIAPFAIACAWLLFLFARPWLGSRTAAVAALAFSVMPPWLPKSVEFRNDTLWIFFWLAGLALLTRRRGPAHLLAGIAFGLSLLASIKAVPLLLAHLLAIAVERRTIDTHAAARTVLGTAIPPLVCGLAAAAFGALDAMIYDTLLFNAAAPIPAARRIGGAVTFAVIGVITFYLARRRPRPGNIGTHLGFFAFWYATLLLGFWPILTARDFLPLVPLAGLALAIALRDVPVRRALAAAVLGGIATALLYARVWRPADVTREEFVDQTVGLTAPGDYVLDLKGDAIFRRRPIYYIYEDVGRALTASGSLPDRGPEQIAATGCCAAMCDSPHLPPRTRAFLNQHFIGSGPLRVCGAEITGTAFDVAVPQTYAVETGAPEQVRIDGTPYRGPRRLSAGRHTIDRGGNPRVTVLWWRAAAKENV